MRNLLFSKSQRKHYSDTVVRIGKNNLGFSLVELIIVIAIMAILVAVAIPVLGVFIEKAKISNDKQLVSDVFYAIDLGTQSMDHGVEIKQTSGEALQVPVGVVVITNGLKSDGKTAADTFKVFGSGTRTNESGLNYNEAAIRKMLSDTLGEDYESKLVLNYAEWEGNTIPGLYGDSQELYSTITSLSDMLAKYDSILQVAKYPIGSYDTGPEVLAAVSNTVTETYQDDSDFWSRSGWNTLITDENHAFLLNSSMEAYIAARRAYNEALAKYVIAQTGHTHAADIATNGTTVSLPDTSTGTWLWEWTYVDVTVSKVAVANTFSTDGNTQNDDTSASFKNCDTCKNCVAGYYSSTAAENDARAFYQMMVTIDDVSDTADKSSWTDYTEFVDNFSNAYVNVDAFVEGLQSCIVITVRQDPETGLLYCECNTPGVLDE